MLIWYLENLQASEKSNKSQQNTCRKEGGYFFKDSLKWFVSLSISFRKKCWQLTCYALKMKGKYIWLCVHLFSNPKQNRRQNKWFILRICDPLNLSVWWKMISWCRYILWLCVWSERGDRSIALRSFQTAVF